MAKRPDERLIEFLQRELDDGLRGVYRYGSEGAERLWPPDDAARTPSEAAAVDRCVGAVRHVSERRRGDPASAPTPATDGLVWLADDRVVVLLPGDPTGAGNRTGGFVVTIDRQSSFPGAEFLEACLAATR